MTDGQQNILSGPIMVMLCHLVDSCPFDGENRCGVRGIRLREATVVGSDLLIRVRNPLSLKRYGKRTPVQITQSRVVVVRIKTANITEKNGPLAGIAVTGRGYSLNH